MCAEPGRAALRGVVAALLLACASAVAAACGSESEPEPGTAAEAAAQASPAPDDTIVPRPPAERPAAPADEMHWLLELDVAQTQELEVLRGTPLLFVVSLTGAGKGPAGRLGGAAQPWHTQVELELAESGEPAPWPVLTLAPRSLVFVRDAAKGGAVRDEEVAEAVVAPDRVHLLTLAVAPEPALRMAVGRYVLRAVVRRPDRTGEAARVVSEPVTVLVREAAEDPAAQAVLERRRTLAEAEFDVRTGRFEEAERLAAQLVERDPADADAHLLLGDAAVALRQDEQARDAYLAVLDALATARGPLDEPPQGLIERLSALEQRLAPPEETPEAANGPP